MSKISNVKVFMVDPYFGVTFLTGQENLPTFSTYRQFNGNWVGSEKYSNLDLGWVKSMPGDFGKFLVNIGLSIHFLAFGTLFVTLRDTSSYPVNLCFCVTVLEDISNFKSF